MAASRKDIGNHLEKNFGGFTDQNKHLDVFAIVVEDQHADRIPSHFDFDRAIGSGGDWPTPGEFPGVFCGICPKIENESERQREERLNLYFRNAVRAKVKEHVGVCYDIDNVSVMLHRVCKYTGTVTELSTPPVTTEEIGAILKDDCGKVYHDAEETHINYFFMKIQTENPCQQSEIASKLKGKLGSWSEVLPKEKWPNTFFGYFPKKSPQETERQREECLDQEVRIPLRDELENQTNGPVHILLMRACKYT